MLQTAQLDCIVHQVKFIAPHTSIIKIPHHLHPAPQEQSPCQFVHQVQPHAPHIALIVFHLAVNRIVLAVQAAQPAHQLYGEPPCQFAHQVQVLVVLESSTRFNQACPVTAPCQSIFIVPADIVKFPEHFM